MPSKVATVGLGKARVTLGRATLHRRLASTGSHAHMGTAGHLGQLGDYLARIDRYPVLERERELDLARRYLARGDRRAGEWVIGAHLRDVVAIARRYRGYGQPQSELIAAGNLGLVRALERFDPERGLRFMTYASYWVRAEILSHVLHNWSAVGVGKSSMQVRLFFGLRSQRARLESRGLSAEALEDALAQHFGCTVQRIRAVQARLDQRDAPFDTADEPRLERSNLEHWVDQRHQTQRVEACLTAGLEDLDVRERRIVECRLLEDEKRSLVELGIELGISRERVRQLEQRAHKKLRRHFDDDMLGS